MLGSLAQSAIYLTNSVFVGRLGEVPLAAIGLGGLLFYLLTTVGSGCKSLPPTASARAGAAPSAGCSTTPSTST